jgi:hypothetical protein
MNMTGFVHPHQKKRHDEADSGPLETPDGQFKHVGQTLLRELRRSRTGCHASSPGKDRSAARESTAIAGEGRLLASQLLPGNF